MKKLILKEINENRVFIISIIAILFIPILYAGNFINAFADPYNRMEDVAVAVVNNDKTIAYNGEEVNIGDKLESELKSNKRFKWDFVTEKEAKEGMKNNEYYFTIEIPTDFSTNIYSTLSGTQKDANLIYEKNDNNNFISGILGGALLTELKGELNSEITNEFLVVLGKNLDTTSLSNATSSLLSGSNTLSSGLSNLYDGTLTLKDATTELATSGTTLSTSMNSLNSNYTTFNTKLSSASSSLTTITNGYTSLNSSISSLRSSLDAAINSSTLSDSDKATLISSYDQILGTSTYLNSNLQTVSTGETTLATNSNLIGGSITKLNSGATTLVGYLSELDTKSTTLVTGAKQLTTGSKTLSSGLKSLNSGVTDLKTSLDKLDLKDNAKNISKAVNTKDEAYSEVTNYGYGFAPYFVSLGLFVGALVTTIVLSMKEKKKRQANISTNKYKAAFKKIGLFSFVVISQALILDFVLLVMQIHITHNLVFVLFTVLMSLTFMAIIQMLSTLFNDVGRFISIILLICQLTACGGTFPIETSPDLYQVLHPFMPMTYTVDGLKAIIGNGNQAILSQAVFVLIGISIVCYTIIIIYFRKSKKFN